MTFVNNLRLPQLGNGAGFALWSFRAIASGCSGCDALKDGFDQAFGPNSDDALGDMICLAKTLGSRGARPISLAGAGCCQVTADELSFVATLASAQQFNTPLCMAHLSWLMGGRHMHAAYHDACCVADKFKHAGLSIVAPEIELVQPQKTINGPILNIVGNA